MEPISCVNWKACDRSIRALDKGFQYLLNLYEKLT
jgi:hypothetical protein